MVIFFSNLKLCYLWGTFLKHLYVFVNIHDIDEIEIFLLQFLRLPINRENYVSMQRKMSLYKLTDKNK